MAVAIYSAVTGIPVDNRVAMTGEVSIYGSVRPVGGVPAKVEAARLAGARRVVIPVDNDQERLHRWNDVDIVLASRLEDALSCSLLRDAATEPAGFAHAPAMPLQTSAAAQGSV